MKRSKNQEPRAREAPRSKLKDARQFNALPCYPTLHERLILNDGERHVFDLEERTAVFGENIVRFSKKIPYGPSNNRLIDQLVGCATTIGGNYCEANEGVSKKDFRHPLSRCVKEAKETKFFLRMIVASEPELANEARTVYREAHELKLIFASMYRK
jgi:four helix bundle protein